MVTYIILAFNYSPYRCLQSVTCSSVIIKNPLMIIALNRVNFYFDTYRNTILHHSLLKRIFMLLFSLLLLSTIMSCILRNPAVIRIVSSDCL
ncbi:hypothetical protein HD806DRAFT_505033, partial [Xylariaceae sp. AK1471]